MLTDIPVLAVVMGLLGVVVGLQIADKARRRRSRRHASVAPLMTPVRWVAVGLLLLLVGIFWPDAKGPRQNTPRPAARATTPPSSSAPAPSASAASPEEAQTSPSRAVSPNSTREAADPATPSVAPGLAKAATEEQRWCRQGDRMMAVGQYGMAAQAYWEALRIHPYSQRARAGLTRARRAEAAAEAAREPENPVPVETSPAMEKPQERPAQGTPPTDTSRWGPQEDARFHVQRGDRLLERGMAQAAIAEYQKVLESSPSDAQARAGLARARSLAAGAR